VQAGGQLPWAAAARSNATAVGLTLRSRNTKRLLQVSSGVSRLINHLCFLNRRRLHRHMRHGTPLILSLLHEVSFLLVINEGRILNLQI